MKILRIISTCCLLAFIATACSGKVKIDGRSPDAEIIAVLTAHTPTGSDSQTVVAFVNSDLRWYRVSYPYFDTTNGIVRYCKVRQDEDPPLPEFSSVFENGKPADLFVIVDEYSDFPLPMLAVVTWEFDLHGKLTGITVKKSKGSLE